MSWIRLDTSSQENPNGLLYLTFNQDFGCFAAGTNKGFRIYNCEPFKETWRRDFAGGGIGIIEMLFRCNILALVGGGKNPRFPSNKLIVWDDQQNKSLGQFSFRSEVHSVKMRRDRVVAVVHKKIFVYNFKDLKLAHQIDTVPNPHGLCALCSHVNNAILACPGRKRGQVRVELFHLRKTTVIPAHESDLRAIALNFDGSLLATASERGTLIRVFDTDSGKLLHEFRRGVERAVIHCIAFNAQSTFLACTSDKGTVHVFKFHESVLSSAAETPQPNQPSSTPVTSAESAPATTTVTQPSKAPQTHHAGSIAHSALSTFTFVKGFMPKYFNSEWSFAQFRVPESQSICAFGSSANTLLILCADASLYKIEFDPIKGGEAVQKEYSLFVPPDDSASDGIEV